MACSGTIETPTEEFPPRRTSSTAAANADDDDDDNTPAPPAPSSSANDDDDEAESQDPPSGSEDDLPADDDSGEDDLPADDDPPAAGGGDLSFESDIHPIFELRCGPCHAGAGSGGQDIGGPDLESALQDAIDFEAAVIADMESGSMPIGCGAPPGGGGNCVTEDEFQDIVDWYEAGAPE